MGVNYGSGSVRAMKVDHALKGCLAESRCPMLIAFKIDTVTVMDRKHAKCDLRPARVAR